MRKKRRIGLQGELVPRKMLRIEGKRLINIFHGLLRCLLGQAVHEIDIEVIESRRSGFTDGSHRFVAGMNSPQRTQLSGAETLHPQRQSIDTGFPITNEPLLLGRAWIGFQGDFNRRRKGEAFTNAIE